LGAILFELLTGARAQSFTIPTELEIRRVVCYREPPRPSVLAKGLDADLDNIVLMAMRKEPERRYSSVDQMGDDIRRHLSGLPVVARRNSAAYRAGKFVGRSRIGLIAGLVVVGSLIAAVLVSGREARRAQAARIVAENQERTADRERARAERAAASAEEQRHEAELQRTIADHERGRAQSEAALASKEREVADRRFEQVRQLAGKFLFDFHDAIATLPGSTPARKKVVETGLRYYDALVREVSKGSRCDRTVRG
jgi:hypothetical protein